MASHYSDQLQMMIQTKMTANEKGELIPIHSDSPPAVVGEYLYNLVRAHDIKNVVEVGLAFGFTSRFIAEALALNGDSNFIVIDPHQFSNKKWAGIGIRNLRQSPLAENFSFIEDFSYRALPDIIQNRGPASLELVFVDGMHLFDYALVDFFFADLLLKTSGFLVFDDYQMPSIEKLAKFILTNRNYRLVEEIFHDQKERAIVFQKTADDNRHYRDFINF